MPDASALPTMTVEEYFRFEERSPIKHEYVAGEVYAMSGATWRHNLIAGTIFGILLGAEGAGSCRAAMSDMRVEVANDRYYYPDVTGRECRPFASAPDWSTTRRPNLVRQRPGRRLRPLRTPFAPLASSRSRSAHRPPPMHRAPRP